MEFFKTVFRQKNFMFKLGIIVCLLWVIVAFIAPLIAPADPLAQNLDMRFQPPGAAPLVRHRQPGLRCIQPGAVRQPNLHHGGAYHRADFLRHRPAVRRGGRLCRRDRG